jgi:2-amino-4-hydroxy-6-hydroxymethyldihydropteridine diphosphokinase
MVQAVVTLGGNIGDVARTFQHALTQVNRHGQVASTQAAGLYQSVAMGVDAGDAFYNSAWVLETSLDPEPLLDLLQRVENDCGRTRERRWGPRTLDLDLVFYGAKRIDSPRLTVPHPHCWYRRFVLAAVESLLPDLVHPVIGLTVRELLHRLTADAFELVLGGPLEVTGAMQSVAKEFPNVEVRLVETPGDIDVSKVSLAVWFSDGEEVDLNPLWLRLPVHETEQHLRDTLIAACSEVAEQ